MRPEAARSEAARSEAARSARAAELFLARFGAAPDGVWLAPGRANLMGEHTDYNDGFVLPFALSQGTTAAAGYRPDRRLVLCSRQEPGRDVELALDDLAPGQVTGWAAYLAGIAWALSAAGYQVPGACIAIDSDLPTGAGLSSSAALECATGLALIALAAAEPASPEPVPTEPARAGAEPARAGAGIGRPALAAIAQRAENEFVGVPSGIMDQSASLLGQAGHALLLDCRSLETAQVPFDPAAADARLMLINTRAKHELSDGEYGQRRAECEQAARLLGVPSLRSVTDVRELDRLADPVLRRRARHIVTDNQRVLEVVELLRSVSGAAASSGGAASSGAAADLYREIGRLLTAAHVSLRDDFEVSWPEADATVDAALAAGALGARMMGGGFGGSVLLLTGEATDSAVRAAVSGVFAGRGWTSPEFLDATPSSGARRLA
jgi:galactokinase